MDISTTIAFMHPSPSPQAFLEKVSEVSGLKNILLERESSDYDCYVLKHSDFTELEFDLLWTDDKIIVSRMWDEPWYLLDVTIGSLIQLGGKISLPFSGESKELYTIRKWEEVKDDYPPVLDSSFYRAMDKNPLEPDEEIEFSTKAPLLESILEPVRKMSGLTDIKMVKHRTGTIRFIHPLFNDSKSFLILYNDKSIVFWRPYNDPNYLLQITISVLENMGGKYIGRLKEYTDKPWKEVKNLFIHG